MEDLYSPRVRQALQTLRDRVPQIVRHLQISLPIDIDAWTGILDRKLLPRLSPEAPLIGAICGGGSSGKSTLFNTLAGQDISPAGGRAGMNRRVLIACHPGVLQNPDLMACLFDVFDAPPQPLRRRHELTTPGPPLYVATEAIPRTLILLDTPDFDTGGRGAYTNREAARQALEASDVLIYIFTNSNYNNRDNTNFIAAMLTDIGLRKCFLLYRVYPSFTDQEVREHAATVAWNLYGDQAGEQVLGVYRADEDNAVAAGAQPMALRTVEQNVPPLVQALQQLDPLQLRPALLASGFQDLLVKTDLMLAHVKSSRHALRQYVETLQAVQNRCAREALSHFPMDLMMKRFAEIWLDTDPAYIKIMRRTGSIVELPLKVILRSVKWARALLSDEKRKQRKADFREQVQKDLIESASRLFSQALASEIVLPPLESEAASKPASSVHVHPALTGAQDELRNRGWQSILQAILAQEERIVALSETIDQELHTLVAHFRREMGFGAKISQTFSAFLNVVPATAAVTYILHTGDPVGATGIKVKLSSLFGLHDLYALIAIPATSGLKKAERNQLEELLAPIVKAWLNDKLNVIQEIFKHEITGGMLGTAADLLASTAQLVKEIETSSRLCGKAALNP